jgi:putative spermidine/putrescine transport system permease protein
VELKHLPGDLPALLQALPLTAVLGVFLLVPIVTLTVVSFFDYDSVQIIPGFVLTNYADVLFSATTWWTYLETLKFTAIVWALTLLIGFWVAYFLTFCGEKPHLADNTVPGLHGAFPHLRHHPHDLMGSVP